MSTTTQILFNSPALHSLKRDQLVKLCKIHSIKASGKNVELIEKLRKHAETMPKDSPLSIAARSEGVIVELTSQENQDAMVEDAQFQKEHDTYVRRNSQMPRPSEQWEVVMESIEELEESSSQGAFNSFKSFCSNAGASGEFGTAMSKSSSITSSIKSFASSFGLKRTNSSHTTLVSSSSSTSDHHHSTQGDDLTKHSTPYFSLAAAEPPQTDHFTFHRPTQSAAELLEPQEPLPGHTLRPGIPAPLNARLSLGLNPPVTPSRKEQPTTTIRLISKPSGEVHDAYGRTPQLKPFQTSSDLVLGSPQTLGGFRGTMLWPNDVVWREEGRIYPSLQSEVPLGPTGDLSRANAMPGTLSFSPLQSPRPLPDPPSTPTTSAIPPSSDVELLNPWPRPLPLPPDNTTANARLGTSPGNFIFGSPLPEHSVSNEQFKSAAASVLEEMNKRLGMEGVAGVDMGLVEKLRPDTQPGVPNAESTKFDEKKIANASYKEKFDQMHQKEFNKMEGIDELVKRKYALKSKESEISIASRRKSSVVGRGAGRDRHGRRISGHVGRVSTTRVVSEKKPRVIPGGFDDEDSGSEGEAGGGVVSTGKTDFAMVEDRKADAKAKEEEGRHKEKEAIRRQLEMNRAKRRSSVAARGRVSVGRGGVFVKPEPQPKPSRFGFLSTAKSIVQSVWGRGKSKATAPVPSTSSTSGIPKLVKPQKCAVPPVTIPASSKISLTGGSRFSVTANSTSGSSKMTSKSEGLAPRSSSIRARSPIPSFVPSTKSSQTSSAIRTGAQNAIPEGGYSFGTKSMVMARSSSAIGSAAKKISGTATAPTSSANKTSRLSSTSSRLLAPTASSLAKTARPSASGLKTTRNSGANVSNDPKASLWSPSPRQEKIFSSPLQPLLATGIPSPAKSKAPDFAGPSCKAVERNSAESSGSLRQRSLNGRKPRISRSKVIAKLASQRAAGVSGGGTSVSSNVRGINGKAVGKRRSSLGVKAQRSSFAGAGGRLGADPVLLSAKKKARQSEYQARKSRVQPIDLEKDGMDIDKD